MGEKRAKRPAAGTVRRLAELRAGRRKDVAKAAIGLVAACAVVLVKTALEASGAVAGNDAAFANLAILAAMGLAVVTGTASIDYTKKGKELRELCEAHGLTVADAKHLTGC